MRDTESSIRHEPSGRRAFLLTSPRTASNLFIRMLNLHDRKDIATRQPENSLDGGGYFFGKPVDFWDDNYGIGTPYRILNDDAKKAIGDAFQSAMDDFVSVVASGEQQGQIVFIKEHIVNLIKPEVQADIIHGRGPSSVLAPWAVHIPGYNSYVSSGNPTIFPDAFLCTFMPTILIRHPAVAFPSEYRAEVVARKAYGTEMRNDYSRLVLNYSAIRQLYDYYYYSHFQELDMYGNWTSTWPFVVDAADLITNPEPYMLRFCELTSIDNTKLRYSWQPLTKDQLHSIGDDAVRRFLDTLNFSSAVEKDKACVTVDVDAEVKRFTEEFGEEIGHKMEGWIRGSLSDYEYLRSKWWDSTREARNGFV